MSACTHDLKAKLEKEGVDATYNLRPTGTHSWPAWLDDVNSSWPTFARGLDLPEDPNATPEVTTYSESAKKEDATDADAADATDAAEAADTAEVANEKAADADIKDTDKAAAEADPAAPADSLPVDPAATEQ